MKKKIIVFFVLFGVNILFAQQFDRAFPYRLPLTGTSKPSAITEHIGNNAPTGDDRYTKEGLVLTYGDDEDAFSGFALDKVAFTSNYGIIVEFKYAMTDGYEYGGRYGDGISMFLYDASKKFEIGGYGASLGYAYRSSTPGLNGAYLGVGLDYYGDYKIRNTSSGELREGINGVNFMYHESHVTVRGGQYKSDRLKGYPVLYTTQTDYANGSGSIPATASLNYSTGDYDLGFYAPGNYNLRTSRDYYDNYNFGTVVVTLLPINNGKDGMTVQVDIKPVRGYLRTIIYQFDYPNSFKTRDSKGNLYNFETTVPREFKVGFAAGTGGATQTQIIKDVEIRLPYAPITNDIVIPLCRTEGDDNGRSVFVDPFKGASFYTGTIEDHKWGDNQKYVDFNTFRFEDENGFEVGKGPIIDKYGYSIWTYEDDYGTWEFQKSPNGTGRNFYFTPDVDDLPEGNYVAYFSAKSIDDRSGGPFADDAYRSRPTKVTVKAQRCKALVNPHLPLKVLPLSEETEDN